MKVDEIMGFKKRAKRWVRIKPSIVSRGWELNKSYRLAFFPFFDYTLRKESALYNYLKTTRKLLNDG